MCAAELWLWLPVQGLEGGIARGHLHHTWVFILTKLALIQQNPGPKEHFQSITVDLALVPLLLDVAEGAVKVSGGTSRRNQVSLLAVTASD